MLGVVFIPVVTSIISNVEPEASTNAMYNGTMIFITVIELLMIIVVRREERLWKKVENTANANTKTMGHGLRLTAVLNSVVNIILFVIALIISVTKPATGQYSLIIFVAAPFIQKVVVKICPEIKQK